MADEGSLPDVDDAADRARDILDGPAYREPEESYVARGLGWLWDRFIDFLNWIEDRWPGPDTDTGASFGGSGRVGYIVGWVVLALALGFIGWILFRVMPRRRLQRLDSGDPITERSQRQRTSRQTWLQRAADAENRGDFAAAVHARYRALVAGLVDRRELPDAVGTTSGEHLRSFPTEEPRHRDFADVTDRFERIWFGIEAAGPDDSLAMARGDQAVYPGDPSRSERGSTVVATAEPTSPLDTADPRHGGAADGGES